MKKIIAIVAVIVIGGISAYAISPYFTTSTIDEVLPESALSTDLSDVPVIPVEKTMDKELTGETMGNEMTSSMFYQGDFVGVNDGIHNAEGKARVIPLDDGSSILRLEDFESTNGPDLYVYLSTDEQASDYVNLGRLKANSGNQNYELPEGIDLSKHNNVLIWCQAFGVLFGSAELQQ